jgi:hypothetical protein
MPSIRQSHRRQNSRSAPQFVLNVSRIAFKDADVRVGIIPYKDREQLARLRSTHGATQSSAVKADFIATSGRRVSEGT